MRITTLLILVTALHVSARTTGQKVTLSSDNITIARLFQQLNKQTGYSFLLKDAIISADQRVSVHVKNASLQQVLNDALEPLSLSFEIDNRIVFIIQAQKAAAAFTPPPPPPVADVSGRVIDSMGIPFTGASVHVKGMQKGTQTNVKGEFELKGIADDATLVISYTGYNTLEITINSTNRMPLIVMLRPSNNELDETIVQAYGTTSRRLATGSISTVKAAELQKQPVGNMLAALEGLVPGLQISQQTGVPGGNFSVQLRGLNSLSQSVNPLYVVDGIPYPSNTLTQALYNSAMGNNGANPLNGINMADIESITVLKDAAATAIYGARGANGVILITMKKGKKGATKVDVNAYSGWGKNPRRIQLMNTPQYLAMRHEAFANGGTTPTTANAPDLMVWDTTKYTDWQDYFWGGTAHYNDIQASVSGGSGNTGFLLGGGYHEEGTVFPGNAKDAKGAMHFSVNHASVNGRFKAVLTGSFTHDHMNLPPQDLSSQITLAPNQPELLKADGSLNWPPGAFNPLAYFKQPYNAATDNLVSSASLSYAILPGLQLKTDMGYTNLRSTETQITPLSSINPAYLSFSSSSANFGNSEYKVWNIEPQINYTLRRGANTLTVLAGSTIQSSFSKGMLINATGFLSDALLNNMQAAKTLTISTNTNTNTKDNSLFGRISYNHDEKYLVDLTARRDGSSRFGPGKQFGNFGAVGLGWVFTKESFLKNSLRLMNFGKLRASYGTVGNAPGADYQYLSLWTPTTYAYDTIPNLYPTNLFNQNYAWEVTHKLELGADLEFLAGRIRLTADYYRNSSSNQLVTYNLPAITGFTGITANLPATVRNTGWELSLQTTNIDAQQFRWTSHFTFSAPRNELVSFPDLATSSYATRFIIGQPIYITRQYHFAGVDPQTGVYQYQTKAGTSSSPSSLTDKYSTYDPRPKYWGALGNDFSYKGFTLSILFTYAKQKGLNTDPPVTPGSVGNLPVSYLDRWRKAGDISSHQKVSYPGYDVLLPYFNLSTSDVYVQDASYIRLKNLALSYQLPTRLLSGAHITSSRVYLQCQNLLTITSFPGLDPETQGSAVLPPLRVITAGIQFTL